MSADAFFKYARDRYEIKLRKDAGMERPWTTDPILQEFRFCNVHREHDEVTKWIRHFIKADGYGPAYLGAIVIARWFNRIPTLSACLPRQGVEPYFMDNLFFSWMGTGPSPHEISIENWREKCRDRLADLKPLVTGAYMIKTPPKMSKLDGILDVAGKLLYDAPELQTKIQRMGSMKWATEKLTEYPYLGPFMAYEVVCDLRWSPILCEAADKLTWANPGPGAARGLSRIHHGHPHGYDRNKPKHAEPLQKGMRELLELARSGDDSYWPAEWPEWEMREVEHTLCEFDKYERVRLGEGTPKQKYVPART